MDLKEQKYVCTLAECKSLTRASERLYISQPALSLYINNVEKILGARLFERNGRKFELTWLGKQYVEKASQMLELERQFEAVRRQTDREDAGQVRIGIAQRRGIWFLPAVLSVYEREWPQVDVVIREGNLADLTIMLKNRELDLVVLSQSDVTSEMEAVPLGMEDFLLILPGDHPLNEKAVPVEGSKFDFLDPHQRNKIRTFFLWERGSDFSFSSRKRIPVQLLLPKSAVEEENHVLSDLVLQKTSSLSF